MADVLSAFRPPVISFHFGLPPAALLARIRSWRPIVISSATTVDEAKWLEAHGVELIGVEPEGAAKLSAALAAGKPAALQRTARLADGLLPVAGGRIPWQFIGGRGRRAFRIGEADIASAVRFLFRELALKLEPSGAIAAAALLGGQLEPSGPVAAILSGGNVDPELFDRLTA